MTETASFRQKYFNVALALSWLHAGVTIMLSDTYEYRSLLLGSTALFLALVFYGLHSTKYTLPLEKQIPKMTYILACVAWTVIGLMHLYASSTHTGLFYTGVAS